MGFVGLMRKVWRHRKDDFDIQYMAIGVNSSTDITKDKHIIMLDFDVKDRGLVVKSVEELQVFWNLAEAHIFVSKNGFHVFFWYDQVPYGRLKMIIEYARDVDPMFKFISRFYDHKTLRVIGKHKVRDIAFEGIVRGVREPSEDEKEIGEMKRREHLMLLDPNNPLWKVGVEGAFCNKATKKGVA